MFKKPQRRLTPEPIITGAVKKMQQPHYSTLNLFEWKGPVKLIKRVKIAQSFFIVCVKSVPRYHFKLAYVILRMAVKEFFKPTSKNGDIGHFNL